MAGAAVAMLDPNRVIKLGGHDGFSVIQTTEILTLPTMTFESGPKMLTRRRDHAAVMLNDFRLLVLGGYNGVALDTTEILDLNTMTFSPGPRMGSRREECFVFRLNAGRAIVLGTSGDAKNSCCTS